jgi:hypothetical protein
MQKRFKEFIKKLVDEVLSELDEATVTGDIGGYSTPYAFSGKKKKKKYATTSTGYKLPK